MKAVGMFNYTTGVEWCKENVNIGTRRETSSGSTNVAIHWGEASGPASDVGYFVAQKFGVHEVSAKAKICSFSTSVCAPESFNLFTSAGICGTHTATLGCWRLDRAENDGWKEDCSYSLWEMPFA